MKQKIQKALQQPSHSSGLNELASRVSTVGMVLAIINLIGSAIAASGAGINVSATGHIEPTFSVPVFITGLISSALIVGFAQFMSSIISALATIATDASAAKNLAVLALEQEHEPKSAEPAPATTQLPTETPLPNESKPEIKKPVSPVPADGKARLIPQDEETGVCSACGKVQRINRNICMGCNLKFEK